MPFDVLTAFSPVGLIGATNFALVVHPSIPADNARAFVDWVKAQTTPVEYASPGKGTFHHLTMEWIANITGIKLTHVPYKGSAPALQDLLGGHVKATIVPLHVAAPLAAERKLRIVGATRKERDRDFPNIVPLNDTGVRGLDADAWYGVWGPRGMSAESVARYNEALRAALSDPQVQSTLHKQGVTSQASTPEALNKLSREEHAKWGALIKTIKLPQE
ncbi:MAG TPA: tripartite tricarboxylate transporter substrate binding protein [Ramlibacter sp.]|nr:tripartite tricarboxylate transporter substrate binding protein [Ramlibacter sp.]